MTRSNILGKLVRAEISKQASHRFCLIAFIFIYSIFALNGANAQTPPTNSPAIQEENLTLSEDDLRLRKNLTYPKWKDFPNPPKEMTTSKAFDLKIQTLNKSSQILEAQRKLIVWDAGDPDALSKSLLVKIKPLASDILLSREAIEGLAQKMRAQSKTPAPYDRY